MADYATNIQWAKLVVKIATFSLQEVAKQTQNVRNRRSERYRGFQTRTVEYCQKPRNYSEVDLREKGMFMP